ncbi:serine/threonine-protein phosphatase with EF-hands 1 isoform X1 [Mauremys reevesii]|uniref:serine/threonine-protein phosphatase with EF-hands 1 isoform X1 n=1 Tax=Mauremys reevesii TaxID=260615 RepID=UPI00193FB437|nr:serine/threonine-protein phosphatase with EF-hands 1 isoform X1 [Mauremys reevesii]XP_039375183.1 serine/threonine-protein phosphatase with EF-hands 1 isoform X1 [Mauremys reevesii]XP_039375184.1 serine/threonine-protein phosphatase with EF-hands 1 isoform X1 [Mauremys reevesii]XP_039375185.1 serine/threonine-protein phosphatase with EF-hands 1 isoform X1 [Mauremys reevesii]XP_039375194.1 serine/threonine-protein phosphatase with EF-hands 1 isoform X1 [Mauremys reevesii]XP_039375201.1 serin
MGCGTSVTGSRAKKSERAIKAAILIQRWYRCYMARLEMRRQYALSIFQSIEYAEEQAQLQLSSFFTFMLDHFTHLNETDTGSDVQLLEYERMIEVPDSYHGPRLSFPLTVADTNSLLHAFKDQQHLHARYVLQLLHETKKLLKQMPNIIHLSTSYSKEITICGDLHGKLDDLLLIFYKNGLPSEENPYLFNGDFVDRGKNSIEILIILFSFLLVYPNHLHLNRGNHEDHIVNLRYGFTKEVMKKYRSHGKKILNLLQDVYSWLPLATVIDSKVLIVHGGISDTTDLDFLNLFKRNKMKSVLRPPRQDIAVKGMTRPSSSSSHRRQYTSDLLDVGKHMWLLHDDVNSGPLLEAQYLVSSVRMQSVPSELTAKEWKQVVDILWSDPKNQNGCTPNKVRGGGCYFGPDVTARLLKRYNLKMLIRSHECKQEGYEISHHGQVITIFSASNYYEDGSNRGAYLKLNPDLIPRFVQYQVSKCTRKQTLHQRVSVVEWSALKSLREKLYSRRSELIAAFRQYDPNYTGRISATEWAAAMESVLHLDLPWRTLRSRLVQLAPDGSVEYLSCFNDLEIEPAIKEVQPALVETLYRYRTDLEIIFNIIDKDHSGLISIEEFRQTWKLFNSHLKIDIDDESIDNLARSIDFNKDGSIDFNEFLEAFHVVNKFENK